MKPEFRGHSNGLLEFSSEVKPKKLHAITAAQHYDKNKVSGTLFGSNYDSPRENSAGGSSPRATEIAGCDNGSFISQPSILSKLSLKHLNKGLNNNNQSPKTASVMFAYLLYELERSKFLRSRAFTFCYASRRAADYNYKDTACGKSETARLRNLCS